MMKQMMKTGMLLVMLIWVMAIHAQRFTGSWSIDYENSHEKLVSFLKTNGFVQYEEGEEANRQSEFLKTVFSMPASHEKEFCAKFLSVLSNPGYSTYFSSVRAAGASKVLKKFYYGVDKKYSVIFGDKINQNVAIAYYAGDKKEEVYAVVWEANKNVISGTVYLLRGKTMTKPGITNVDTATGFIEEFSRLRTAFKLQAKKSDDDENKLVIQTGLANKMMQLCQNGKHLLSSAERKLCSDAIVELQNSTNDSFLKKLLERSVQILKK